MALLLAVLAAINAGVAVWAGTQGQHLRASITTGIAVWLTIMATAMMAAS